jgi:TetR/AcrR family transcriptional regulator, regulator of autoinduction and epiphytic fitness
VADVTRIDGRTLRREENRASVLEALGELYREGLYDPNVAEIAARAGLSQRSLFRYFDDVDDLNRAAIEHLIEGARPLLALGEIDPQRPLDERIDALVAARLDVYDHIAPAARAIRIGAHRRPILAAQLKQGRAFFRGQVEKAFPDVDADAVAAADVLLQFESYDLLPRSRAAAVLTDALTTLLGRRS